MKKGIRLALAFVLPLTVTAHGAVEASKIPPEDHATAEARGVARVIVRLAMPGEPAASPRAEGAAQQDDRRGDIARVGDALLHDLRGTRVRVIHVYPTMPYVALEAGPDALRALEQSRHALSVEADRTLAPLGRGQSK